MTTWPEPVQRVADFLRETRAEARLEGFEEGTPTAADAAKAAGCTPAQIVKSLVFMADGRPVLAMVPGDRRADASKIARAAGAGSARIASAAEVRRATGFPPGGVAPFPLPDIERVLLETTLLAQPLVWVGAGSERHMAALVPRELARLARAEPVDVVEEPAYHASSSTPKGR